MSEQTPAEKAIRAALLRGPTPGPWHLLGPVVGLAYRGEGGEADQLIPLFMVPNPDDSYDWDEWTRNADWLTAVSPERVSALLDELDRLRSLLGKEEL